MSNKYYFVFQVSPDGSIDGNLYLKEELALKAFSNGIMFTKGTLTLQDLLCALFTFEAIARSKDMIYIVVDEEEFHKFRDWLSFRGATVRIQV
jgi:hypothetical protein